jgi:hypothetical protein
MKKKIGRRRGRGRVRKSKNLKKLKRWKERGSERERD